MTLFVIRHAETKENAEKTFQGLFPGTLNETGKQQAKEMGQKLSLKQIDCIYCSPIGRCQKTLEIIKPFLNPNIPIYFSALIQERDFGKFTGKKYDEVDFTKLDLNTPENQSLKIESLDNVRLRIKQFLKEIKQKHSNQNILIISHNNAIRMILSELLDKTYQEILTKYEVSNTSINELELK